MTILLSNTGPVIRAYDKTTALSYTQESSPTAVSPVVTTETNGDATVNKKTATGGLPGYRFIVDASVDRFELENRTPATLDQEGERFVAKTGAAGFGEVLILNKQGASSVVRFSLAATGSTVTYDLTGFRVGTVGKGGFDLIEERLALGGDLLYYNGSSFSACQAQEGGIQRNASCWGADWDLSGVAIQHLYANFNGGGCLVTSRHYVASNHYEPGIKIGSVLKFLGNNGTIYTRTILAQTTGHTVRGEIANPVYNIGDMVVFLLSAPATGEMDNLAVYPIAGDWLVKSAFIEDNGDGTADYSFEWSYPIITTNQYRHLLFATCNSISSGFSVNYPLGQINIDGVMVNQSAETVAYLHHGPAYAGYPDKKSNAVIGDSGSVWFLPLADGSLVAFSHYTTPASGPLWRPSVINALILEVDAQVGVTTGLTVTVAPDPTL
jgi:hypothetical protein